MGSLARAMSCATSVSSSIAFCAGAATSTGPTVIASPASTSPISQSRSLRVERQSYALYCRMSSSTAARAVSSPAIAWSQASAYWTTESAALSTPSRSSSPM
jgi:hypothetical protein